MNKIKGLTKFQKILSELSQLNASIRCYEERLKRIEYHIWNLEGDLLMMKYTLSQLDSFNRMECQQNSTIQHIRRLIAAHQAQNHPENETFLIDKKGE